MKFSIYTFTILLCATLFVAGCKKDNKSNNANTKPKADFTYVISSAVIPDSITFTNTSQGGITYKWQLWDGNTSQSATGFSELISAVPLVPLTVKLIATNNFGSDTVTKTISLASTLITSLPTNALPNSAVTIGGINFGTANNQIILNGVSATVLSSTTTTITFVVPANATSGKMTVNTNGVSIAVNFKVYAPSISAAFPTKYYLKHISYYDWTYTAAATNFLTELYGVNETDSIFFDTHSRMGGGAQYVSNLTGFSIPLGTTIKFLGVTTGYAVGNDYRIYTAGTGVNNFNAGFFAGSGVSGFADGQGVAAQFVAPYAIATYPSTAADVYVTDSHRIRKITAGGLVSTLAGSGADGNADGQGTAATFGDLSGITVDPGIG